jgi:hypothetical protein
MGNYSGWNVGIRQWRIDGTIFVPKNAASTEGGVRITLSYL